MKTELLGDVFPDYLWLKIGFVHFRVSFQECSMILCGASISGLPNPVPLTTSLDLTALRFDHGTFDGFSIDSVVSSLSVVSKAFRNVYLQGETMWNLACYCHFANFVTSSLISFDITLVAGWFQHVSFQIALWKIRDTHVRNLNWLETTNAKLRNREAKSLVYKVCTHSIQALKKQLHIKRPPWLLDLSIPFWVRSPSFRIKISHQHVPWTKSVDLWYLDIYEHTVVFVCARCQVLTLKECQEMLQLSYQILGMFGYVHYFKIHGFLPKSPTL